jgi:hypothetical protein
VSYLTVSALMQRRNGQAKAGNPQPEEEITGRQLGLTSPAVSRRPLLAMPARAAVRQKNESRETAQTVDRTTS